MLVGYSIFMDSTIIDIIITLDFNSLIDRTIISGLIFKIVDSNLKSVLYSIFYTSEIRLWYERLIEIQLQN